MECVACNSEVPSQAAFCPGCGGPVERTLYPGVVLQDRYQIRAPLVPGKADVFLADHLGLEKTVVVKVFDKDQEEVLQSLQNEAQTISVLDSAAVCQLYDVGHLADDRPYVVREFMQGLTLRDAVAEGPIALDKVAGFVEKLCDAVSEVHAVGFLHGDLRAENIFLLRDGGIKLFNFHATQPLADDLTESSFQRKAEVRQLGLLACFMMAGHWPLLRPQGKSVVLNLESPSLQNVTKWLRSYVPGCPSGIDEAVYRALIGGKLGF